MTANTGRETLARDFCRAQAKACNWPHDGQWEQLVPALRAPYLAMADVALAHADARVAGPRARDPGRERGIHHHQEKRDPPDAGEVRELNGRQRRRLRVAQQVPSESRQQMAARVFE